MIKVIRFSGNAFGNDYAVGDIHGSFTKLSEELKRIGFDPLVDRLFSVGDMVDRGKESEEFWDWLRKPWFHAVLGNHEQMAIDAVDGGPTSFSASNHYMNGGEWLYGLSSIEQKCYAEVLRDLPLVIEVETPKGLAVIIHAEVPYGDYNKFKNFLHLESEHENMIATATWARTKAKTRNEDVIPGCYKVYAGHTPRMEGVVIQGNMHYIDQGACFGGELTVVRIE